MMSVATFDRHSSPGTCLEDLLISRFLPKRWMERIWSARQLPERLQRCTLALKPGAEWRAYGDENQVFFAIARMHAADAPRGAATAIDAYFLDEQAVAYAAGVWHYHPRTGWWLDACVDPSYDCDHGWWLGAVLAAPRTPIAASHLPAAAARTARRRKLR
jgi:hypothetical protein